MKGVKVLFINEVEHKVGLSKKSIRFYEENGLLTPKRDANNKYRIYEKKDIEKLKVIKFLRELGVPIRELQLLNTNQLSLKDCMIDRIQKIDNATKNYEKVKNMCYEISKSAETFANIDLTKHIEVMNTLNKEGFTMRDVKTNKAKKIREAVLSSCIFGLFFLFLISILSYFQITENSKIPWVIYIFIMTILLLPVIGIIYNLILRIKEINGGEEDEASKY